MNAGARGEVISEAFWRLRDNLKTRLGLDELPLAVREALHEAEIATSAEIQD